jgi:hypothetical protein
LPENLEFHPEKSLGESFRTPMRNLFARVIADFGEIYESIRDDVPKIRDFSRLFRSEFQPLIDITYEILSCRRREVS